MAGPLRVFLVALLTGNGVPVELDPQVTSVYLGVQSAKVSLFLCKCTHYFHIL